MGISRASHDCRGRKRMKVSKQINDSTSTSTAGATEAMQVYDKRTEITYNIKASPCQGTDDFFAKPLRRVSSFEPGLVSAPARAGRGRRDPNEHVYTPVTYLKKQRNRKYVCRKAEVRRTTRARRAYVPANIRPTRLIVACPISSSYSTNTENLFVFDGLYSDSPSSASNGAKSERQRPTAELRACRCAEAARLRRRHLALNALWRKGLISNEELGVACFPLMSTQAIEKHTVKIPIASLLRLPFTDRQTDTQRDSGGLLIGLADFSPSIELFVNITGYACAVVHYQIQSFADIGSDTVLLLLMAISLNIISENYLSSTVCLNAQLGHVRPVVPGLRQDLSYVRLALERCNRRDRLFNSFGAVAVHKKIGFCEIAWPPKFGTCIDTLALQICESAINCALALCVVVESALKPVKALLNYSITFKIMQCNFRRFE
ncbi:hypothetical protein EVAR_19562_1 [Eumeta japonica]|uniref:Uncharacterized protein n=1 Tax=Eumeta variegata TaxID=151549 RepID=A0A4C1UGH1_EUMVA|nr:hypothetical protein EVAR_19562_1 [Eumeta japonica]